MPIKLNKKLIEIDKDGFLVDPDQWEPAVAEAMADIDGFELTKRHWEVINCLRDYYNKYQIAPDLGAMSKGLSHVLGADKIGKEQLITLFLDSPAKTACKYAGLPEPVSSACAWFSLCEIE